MFNQGMLISPALLNTNAQAVIICFMFVNIIICKYIIYYNAKIVF